MHVFHATEHLQRLGLHPTPQPLHLQTFRPCHMTASGFWKFTKTRYAKIKKKICKNLKEGEEEEEKKV